MADFNFRDNLKNEEKEVETTVQPILENGTSAIVEEFSQEEHAGFNTEELKDPNKINVTIADKEAPLVILFGPPSCGKTMTLIRLTRHLKSIGYKISPIKSFRPSFDENYKRICDNYDIMVNQNDAAKSTDRINFMLVEILNSNSRRLCQILEAPGEFYFNPKEPKAQFPNYVNTIINSNNRKIWCIMIEPDWENDEDRKKVHPTFRVIVY